MPDAPDIRATIGLPPSETVAAFERRDQLREGIYWREIWQDEHARAFTVAKIANLDLMSDIRESLDDVLRNGGTFEQWKANIQPTLERYGWWGEVYDADLTGTDERVFIGDRRLRTIYRTNVRTARAAGQWQRIQALKKVRPFLRYATVGDNRVRAEHAKRSIRSHPAGRPSLLGRIFPAERLALPLQCRPAFTARSRPPQLVRHHGRGSCPPHRRHPQYLPSAPRRKRYRHQRTADAAGTHWRGLGL